MQKPPMDHCLRTTGNLEGDSPEVSQIKRQKIICFAYAGIWCNFFFKNSLRAQYEINVGER